MACRVMRSDQALETLGLPIPNVQSPAKHTNLQPRSSCGRRSIRFPRVLWKRRTSIFFSQAHHHCWGIIHHHCLIPQGSDQVIVHRQLQAHHCLQAYRPFSSQSFGPCMSTVLPVGSSTERLASVKDLAPAVLFVGPRSRPESQYRVSFKMRAGQRLNWPLGSPSALGPTDEYDSFSGRWDLKICYDEWVVIIVGIFFFYYAGCLCLCVCKTLPVLFLFFLSHHNSTGVRYSF